MNINLPSGEAIEVRADGRQVFELINGESVTLTPPTVTVTQVTGTTATISNNQITPAAVGSSRYTVTFPDGSVQTVKLMTCESACLTTISSATRGTGFGGDSDNATKRRRVLRSICSDAPAWFDGTASSMVNRSLASWGC